MRILQVAAMPFPTAQGGQAAVHHMCEALARARHDVHLLTYARGTFDRAMSYTHHRLPDFLGAESFRSGPSLRKVCLDAVLPAVVRRLAGRLRPDVVIGQHVEAAAAVLVAGLPLVFVAHTSLGAELPTYAAPRWTRALGAAGRTLDDAIVRRARAVGPLSRSLHDQLSRQTRRPVVTLPVPWPGWDADGRLPTREEARRSLGFESEDEVVLYAGNLDAYQGWQRLVHACAMHAGTRPRLRVLLATASAPEPFLGLAREFGLSSRVSVVPLTTAADRARAHRAADLVGVTRTALGGFPMKMLEAFAHGCPVVAESRAAAGFDLGEAAQLVPSDSVPALAHAMGGLLDARDERRALGARGRSYLAAHHSAQAFLASFDRLLADV